MAHLRLVRPIGLAAALLALAAPQAGAVVINTPNSPLPKIWIGKDLQCQAKRATWAGTAFVDLGSSAGDGACGTLMTRESPPTRTWGPAASLPFLPATPPKAPWTPGGQVGPYSTTANTQCIRTRVFGAVGTAPPMLQVDEADCYKAGQIYYTTHISARNLLTQANFKVTYYHVAGCQVTGSTAGYGKFHAVGHGIYCTKAPGVFNSKSEGFISTNASFVPTGPPAAKFVQDERFAVAGRIGNSSFNGCIGCPTTLNDDAIGISWFVGLLHSGPAVSRYLISRFPG